MKTQYTHTYQEWVQIASVLRTSWPYVNWPTGSIQRTAEVISAELIDLLHGHAIGQTGFTYRIDEDDWDAMTAMQIAETRRLHQSPSVNAQEVYR